MFVKLKEFHELDLTVLVHHYRKWDEILIQMQMTYLYHMDDFI